MHSKGGSMKLVRMATLQRRSVHRTWLLSEYLAAKWLSCFELSHLFRHFVEPPTKDAVLRPFALAQGVIIFDGGHQRGDCTHRRDSVLSEVSSDCLNPSQVKNSSVYSPIVKIELRSSEATRLAVATVALYRFRLTRKIFYFFITVL
ncbi:hypothetical protein EVAR_78117_1 [Eumeta japonica]|uniref:Uncharacterized protein n=1 Tax=Eumeta variegata TaxID=151549 RepID=A0A4C1T0L1_EUMVA|nr:hypothetical protein EVAR_78117_1 [Eumeta japonica]